MPNAPARPPALSTPGKEPEPEPDAELIDHTQARFAPCPICKHKNRYMPSQNGDAIWPEEHAPIELLNTARPVFDAALLRMQQAAHAAPPPLWKTIMWSDKLCAGRPRQPPGAVNVWFTWPLRNMLLIDASPENQAHFQTRTQKILTWDGLSVPPDGAGRYTMFHCLPVENLIRGHCKAPGSEGVLIDGCMRHGIPHGDGIGVYVYSYFPDIWCFPRDGHCVLELLAEPFFTKLKGGTAGRYVMKAPQNTDEAPGSKCRLMQVVALWCIYGDVPSCMVL